MIKKQTSKKAKHKMRNFTTVFKRSFEEVKNNLLLLVLTYYYLLF